MATVFWAAEAPSIECSQKKTSLLGNNYSDIDVRAISEGQQNLTCERKFLLIPKEFRKTIMHTEAKPKKFTFLGLSSQRISALITFDSEITSADQRCFSSDSALYIT